MRNWGGNVNNFLPFFERFAQCQKQGVGAWEANRRLNHLQRIIAPAQQDAGTDPKNG